MTPFRNAEEFYKYRDDRTLKCVESGSYQTKRCRVSTDPSLLDDPSGRAMLEVSCNLLSRWCRVVSISLPPSERLFGHFILKQMNDADPFGDFSLNDSKGDSDIYLHIGGGENTPNRIHINGAGWLASIGHSIPLPRSVEKSIIGAIGAACIGGAELFKIATGNTASKITGVFDLLTNRKIVQAAQPLDTFANRNFGKLLLVGAGSVGSAAAYCMHKLGLCGEMRVVDDDEIKVVNFNRSPIFGMSNLGEKKAHAVESFLKGSAISCRAEPMLWSDFVRQGGIRDDFDVWIPVANEHDVRWSIQNNLPPLLSG
jgi:hypothetical protein